jgi:hypothetical protein
MMVHFAPRSVVSRLLSAATVLTLVGFAASADLQPTSALASPTVRADVVVGASYLEDDDNDNGDENRDENRDEKRDEENNERKGNGGNAGGEGLFSLICSIPGFANNVGCATGLLGN